MASLPSWACVILGCLSASSAEASTLSDLYPPLWEECPGQLSDYRVENGKYVIDPWRYSERMGMYKILINETARYFARFAPENEQNIIWGLPLQFGWQYITGRLADPSQSTDCGYQSGDHLCVSVDSWWADINYYLSAIPFLGAVDSGIMGISSDNVTLLLPFKDQNNFCYNVSTCRSSFLETMQKWNAFYQLLKSSSASFDDLLKGLWTAHVSSIGVAKNRFDDRFKYYSKEEADFQRSWATCVDYLAASLFPTTLIRVRNFQKGLPPRMLVPGDRAPFISNFTAFQNIVLFGVNFVYEVHNITGGMSLTAWKTLMMFPGSRKSFLEILELVQQYFNSKL
ncbi:protein LEG1 homolog [Dasypus novemcinctus]|uniref:protein LEG1 homolog n=1 Tax=Dasypus novemcinctus TaxID=9361 RepID=UPI00265DB8B7|nr:protein LEG1 homolog [Dasypus novemcinctus]